MKVSKKLEELKSELLKWRQTTKNLNQAKETEGKEFARLRGLLKLHNELGNRSIIEEKLKEAIAEEFLKL